MKVIHILFLLFFICSVGRTQEILPCFYEENPDHYQELCISYFATQEEIKKAFKKESLKWHPDKNPNNQDFATQKMQRINNAYQILSDPQKRSPYDFQQGPNILLKKSTHCCRNSLSFLCILFSCR